MTTRRWPVGLAPPRRRRPESTRAHLGRSRAADDGPGCARRPSPRRWARRNRLGGANRPAQETQRRGRRAAARRFDVYPDHGRPPKSRRSDAAGAASAACRLRRRARCGPCDGERPGSRGPRGCACAGGNRGSWPGVGCSAGRCACSRESPLGYQTLGLRDKGPPRRPWPQPAAIGSPRQRSVREHAKAPAKRASSRVRACPGPRQTRRVRLVGLDAEGGVFCRRRTPRPQRHAARCEDFPTA